MAEQVNISEFKARCLALLDRVKRTGHPLLITRRGEVIAQINPPPPPEKPPSWLGAFRSSASITGDLVTPAASEDEWETLTQ